MEEISSHWPTSVGLCGLYLFLVAVIKITENLVDRDVLLDDRFVMPIGHGLAYSYYYGFLKIVLPASDTNKSMQRFCYKLNRSQACCPTTGLRDRAAHLEFEEKIQLASKKLIILIPDSCYCTPSFQDMAPCGQIERVMVTIRCQVSKLFMPAMSCNADFARCCGVKGWYESPTVLHDSIPYST